MSEVKEIQTTSVTFEDRNRLVVDVIDFLQKWGLWKDITIIANNTTYRHTRDSSVRFQNFAGVEVISPADPEKYTSSPGSVNCYGKTEWKSYTNPEHIFDMVFDGPLYDLLHYGEYIVEKKAIRHDAWERIFKITDIINEYMYEYFPFDNMDLMEQLLGTDEYLTAGIDEYNCELCNDKMANLVIWDPTKFNDWDEFQKYTNIDDTGIYLETKSPEPEEEFQEFIDQIIDESSALPAWNKMIDAAKRSFINCDADEDFRCSEMSDYILEEFNSVFKKHDLYYEQGHEWNLSCYQ